MRSGLTTIESSARTSPWTSPGRDRTLHLAEPLSDEARHSARRAESTLWCTGVEGCVQVRGEPMEADMTMPPSSMEGGIVVSGDCERELGDRQYSLGRSRVVA